MELQYDGIELNIERSSGAAKNEIDALVRCNEYGYGWYRHSDTEMFGPFRTLPDFKCPGFEYRVWVVTLPNYRGRQDQYLVRWWVVMAIFFILPAHAGSLRMRRWLRRRRGLCWNCGYDLKATPERCPECGRFAAERN